MIYFKQSIFSVLVVFLVVACGGGGGGSSSTDLGGGGTTGGSASVVTAANAPAIAAEVVATTQIVQDLGDSSTGSFLGAEIQTNSQKLSLSDYARWQIQKLGDLNIQVNAGGIVGVQIGPETEPCDRGTVTLTGSVADPDREDIASGDNVTLTFSNCSYDDLGVTATLSGKVTLVITSLTGDFSSYPFNLVAQFTMTNLLVSDGVDSFSGNGSFTFSLGTSDGVIYSGSMSGNSLSVSESGLSSTLSSFSIGITENDATGAYTITIGGTVSSSDLDGPFTIVTTTPFVGVGDGDPFEGVLVITASDNSSITLIVIDAVNVRLAVDEDGDGVADATINTTWGALDSASW